MQDRRTAAPPRGGVLRGRRPLAQFAVSALLASGLFLVFAAFAQAMVVRAHLEGLVLRGEAIAGATAGLTHDHDVASMDATLNAVELLDERGVVIDRLVGRAVSGPSTSQLRSLLAERESVADRLPPAVMVGPTGATRSPIGEDAFRLTASGATVTAVGEYAVTPSAVGPVVGTHQSATISVLVPILTAEASHVTHVEFLAAPFDDRLGGDLRSGRRLIGLLCSIAGLALFGAARLGAWREVQANRVADRRNSLDPLSGLANRRQLPFEVESRIASGQGFALLVLDLSRLKEVNDTLGHDAGDDLIQEVAARLQMAARPDERIFRVGGDEFTFIVAAASDADAIRAVGRFHAVLDIPLHVRGHAVDVGGAFGIARFPVHGQNGGDLQRRADAAMYAAKRRGHTVRVYTPDLDRRFQDSIELGSGLREALEDGDIRLVYQPIADLPLRTVSSVEGLARWTHRGMPISPDRFVAVAEEVGLTGMLTSAVLRQGIAQAADWHRQGLDVIVSINVFPNDVVDRSLPVRVQQLLSEYDLPGEQLRLEITERAEIVDTGRAAAVLERLRAMGVGVAIDDFGSGSWSLRHLHRLPVSMLKLDKGLIDDVVTNSASRGMVASVAALGRHLGLRLVVEGVEDEETLLAVQELGADAIQGWVFGRPIPVEEMTALLRADATQLRSEHR